MKRISVIYKTFDVVIIPYPFTDRAGAKNRPAVIISSPKKFNIMAEHTVCIMITSSRNEPWPLDFSIQNFELCGLSKASLIRMKIFTIDNRLIKRSIGRLGEQDQEKLRNNLKYLFSELL
jgi:mRNA interferase MazF